jgi:hypothetical protein
MPIDEPVVAYGPFVMNSAGEIAQRDGRLPSRGGWASWSSGLFAAHLRNFGFFTDLQPRTAKIRGSVDPPGGRFDAGVRVRAEPARCAGRLATPNEPKRPPMRFMVIVKADEDSEAAQMAARPTTWRRCTSSTRSSRRQAEQGPEGLQASAKGRAGGALLGGGKRTAVDGRLTETKELVAGFWIWRVEVQGGSDRVGEAHSMPSPDHEAYRDPPRSSTPRISSTAAACPS